MRKALLLITVVPMLLFLAGCPAPTNPGQTPESQIEFAKCFGSAYDDGARSIYQTTDGGCIVAGYTNNIIDNVYWNYDCRIIKLDANGNSEWEKTLGGEGSGYEEASCVIQTSNGCYVIAGYTVSTDGDITGNKGGEDFWVIKLDNSGDVLWKNCYGGSRYDHAYSVVEDTDGNYVVVGDTGSDDFDVNGNHQDDFYPDSYDWWIIKISPEGTLIDSTFLGGSLYDHARDIAIIEGGYIVVGYSKSTDGDLEGINPSNTDNNYWIVKLNTNLDVVWQKIYGGSNSDFAYGVDSTSDGGCIVIGLSYSDDGVIDSVSAHGESDLWLMKLDNSGNIDWQKTLGGSACDVGYSVSETSDGGYVATGYSVSHDGDVPFNIGGHDLWVIRLDNSGNVEWMNSLGGTLDDEGYCVRQTADGSYIVAGHSLSNNLDVKNNHGSSDFWIIKLSDPE